MKGFPFSCQVLVYCEILRQGKTKGLEVSLKNGSFHKTFHKSHVNVVKMKVRKMTKWHFLNGCNTWRWFVIIKLLLVHLPHFQVIFFFEAHGRSKQNLSVLGVTEENLEPTFLHPKSSFPSFISETKTWQDSI